VLPHLLIHANVLLILTVVQVIAQLLIPVKILAHHYKQLVLMILDVTVLLHLTVSQELAHLVYVCPIAPELIVWPAHVNVQIIHNVLQDIAPQKILVNPLVHNKAVKAHMKMDAIAQLILNVLLELAHQTPALQTVLVLPHLLIHANVLLILTVVQVIVLPLILVKTLVLPYKD
jgi:hypothetical protein